MKLREKERGVATAQKEREKEGRVSDESTFSRKTGRSYRS